VIGSGEFSAKKKESLVKRQYQISKRRAAERFERWAKSNPVPIQLTFPTAGIAEMAQQSLGDLMRAVGKIFIETVMESEVGALVGTRSQPNKNREAYRWGTETGYCLIDGQKIPIDRPRVRNRQNNREIPLGSYELFQRASLVQETVWQKIMYGLTMRSYKEVVQQFAEAYGLEKSATCDHFVEASRAKLKELMTRSLAQVPLSVVLIDGTIFKGQHVIVAIGVDRLGNKLVLGMQQGATENATVVQGLLGQLAERGVNFAEPRLYLLDGSRALRTAVISYAGDAAFIQRCQVHKIRNVVEYLPEAQRHAVKFRMRAAYLQAEVADAKNALYKLHDELMELNPSAAGSLAEGMEETLTVAELRLTPRLRQTLSSTNAIESSFSVVARICTQVKRWQGSDHRLRWVASALLFAESHWHKLQGYRHMPVLNNALGAAFRLRLGKAAAASAA
jgi:transposase-like protein